MVVNLDPANDTLPYKCGIDIRKLVNLEDVMERLKLGPNGGDNTPPCHASAPPLKSPPLQPPAFLFCMEYLAENLDWLLDELQKFPCTSEFVPDFVAMPTDHCMSVNRPLLFV